MNLPSARSTTCCQVHPLPDRDNDPDDLDQPTERLLDLLAGQDDPRRAQRIYEQLVERHLGLVNAIASRYRRRGIEWEDLVQVGRLALCKAITGYRPGQGPSFHAYAVPTITGEIKRHFRDHVWDLRPPRRLQELQLDLREHEASLGQQLGHHPSDPELAADLRIEQSALREARLAERLCSTISIDAPTAEGANGACSERMATDDGAYGLVEARIVLRPALRILSPRERRILYLRFVRGWTQQEIGTSLGVSQTQVSRLLSRILARLRTQVFPRSAAS